MKVDLVAMPWHSLESPSLALSILPAYFEADPRVSGCDARYVNLAWADFLFSLSSGSITVENYADIAFKGYYYGIGDWIFTKAYYREQAPDPSAYLDYLSKKYANEPDDYFAQLGVSTLQGHLEAIRAMWELAPSFVDECADHLSEGRPDVVAFTTTFTQTVPSLALARAMKDRLSSVKIVFGGASCDGIMGEALIRNFPEVDAVVRGEGEPAVAGLLDALEGPPREVVTSGLCWRDEESISINAQDDAYFDLSEAAMTDHHAYFATLQDLSMKGWIQPRITVESSRGCWWGERQHCTFCGLNGTAMKYRSKPAERVLAEIVDQAGRYRVLDLVLVDNIMDRDYFESLLPLLGELDWDLNLHFEIKSNVTQEELQLLRSARVFHIQPGIESLSTSILRIMRKGVTGVHNVRMLRMSEGLGLTVAWNYLYGFPDEPVADYDNVIGQMHRFHHLQPPTDAARIALERFSPNFSDTHLGFAWRRPASYYRSIFQLPERTLRDLVYMFESEPAGITGETETRLSSGIHRWRDNYPESRLYSQNDGTCVTISGRRMSYGHQEIEISEEIPLEVWKMCEAGTTRALISKRVGDLWGVQAAFAALDALDAFDDDGFVYRDGEAYISLPVTNVVASVKLGPP